MSEPYDDLTEDQLHGNPWAQMREPERFTSRRWCLDCDEYGPDPSCPDCGDTLATPLDTVTDWNDDWANWPTWREPYRRAE